jgi:hypothetical protein
VHGANLGFSLAAYDRVGGFAPLATGEDVDLVERMQSAGVPWRATDRTRVLTSGRRHGRAPAGFAGFLHKLHPEVPNTSDVPEVPDGWAEPAGSADAVDPGCTPDPA